VIIDTKGSSKSAAFEFSDKSVVDSAISALNGFYLGASKLSLTRVPSNVATTLLIPAPKAPVNQPSSTTSASARAAAAIAALPPDPLKDVRPSRVLRMSNMVTDDDLEDDEAYEELKEDIAEELGLHGSVRSLVIPRPFEKGGYVPGVKQIFVQFATVEEAEKTRKAVAGRTFGGNPVIVYFYPEKLFNKFVYVLPHDFDPSSEEALDSGVVEDDLAEAFPETTFEPVVQEDMD
jgi:splicing factor U2AF 65 kDa subunit